MSEILSASAAGISFLANNPRLARALGRSQELTDSFIEAEEQDAEYRGPSTWHGIVSGGFYDPVDTEDFRGINTPSVGVFGKEDTPSPLGDNFRGPLFTVGNVLEGPVEEGLHNRTPDSVALLETTRRTPGNRAYLGDTLLSPELYGDGTTVRDFIENNPELHDAFTGDTSRSTIQQPADLAYEASLLVPGSESEDFINEGDYSRMIVEDRGELGTLLAEDEELRNLIGREYPDEVIRDRARERVLDAVEPLLSNSEEILTRDWLEANPLVALDLLQRPGFRAWVEESHDNARSLLADADRISDRVRSELPGDAAALVNAIPFDEEWFGSELTLAETVVADQATGADNRLGDWMHTQENTLEYETSGRELAGDYLVETSMTLTENALPRHLFTGSPALSLNTTAGDSVPFGLLADADNINASYPDSPLLSDITAAYRAWGFGYGERLHGTTYEGIA